MAINDVAGGRVYHVWDIPREFLDHNFVSGLCTLKPNNLKTFPKKPRFFSDTTGTYVWPKPLFSFHAVVCFSC